MQVSLIYVVLHLYTSLPLLSTPIGVDYVVIGFDMEVQPLVTHNAICIDVVSNHLLFTHMP